jgi:uncharacterized membrane protein YeaQ/YmgE (transglycosylase-associated protein family)
MQTPLLVTLAIGGVAGWLAGLIMRGSGYGLIGDIVVGLVGALLGSYVLAAFNVSLRLGSLGPNSLLIEKAVVALAGAILLMAVMGMLRPLSISERLGVWWHRR